MSGIIYWHLMKGHVIDTTQLVTLVCDANKILILLKKSLSYSHLKVPHTIRLGHLWV